MSVASDLHKARVASIPCVLCRHLGYDGAPVEIHHIRDGQGAAQRASDFLIAALCPEHHRGASGVHGLGTKGFYTRYNLTELDLLAMTIESVYGR